MKKLLVTAVTLAATFITGSALATEKQAIQEKTATSPLLVMVTSDDAQVQLMSMVLTMQSAQQGAKTQVLLCGPAGDMALRDAPQSVTSSQPPKGLSAQGLMQAVMQKTNTKVEVCAVYLPGKGLDRDALIEGVGVADPADIAKLMIDKETIIVSF